MDERGWDPGVKKYFRKILNSFAIGLFWLMSCATAGIYFQLGEMQGGPHWYNLVFYAAMLISLGLLIWYYYRIWKKD